VLRGLNETLLNRGEPEQFLSAVYLTTKATPQGLEVRFARGGHPPPLLRRTDGTVEAVEAPGALLGCFADPGLKDIRLRLVPGDLLLLYSDGVTEARDGHTEFSEARLRALLAATTPDAHVVVDVIIQAVLTHCGGPTGR